MIKERLNLFKERRYNDIKNEWIQSHPTFPPKSLCFLNVRISKLIDRIKYVLKKRITIYKAVFLNNIKSIYVNSQRRMQIQIPKLKKSLKYLTKDQNEYSQRVNTNLIETKRKVLSIKLKVVQNEREENHKKNIQRNSNQACSSVMKIHKNKQHNDNTSQFRNVNISQDLSNDVPLKSQAEKKNLESNNNVKIKILNNRYILKGISRKKAISEHLKKENYKFSETER